MGGGLRETLHSEITNIDAFTFKSQSDKHSEVADSFRPAMRTYYVQEAEHNSLCLSHGHLGVKNFAAALFIFLPYPHHSRLHGAECRVLSPSGVQAKQGPHEHLYPPLKGRLRPHALFQFRRRFRDRPQERGTTLGPELAERAAVAAAALVAQIATRADLLSACV